MLQVLFSILFFILSNFCFGIFKFKKIIKNSSSNKVLKLDLDKDSISEEYSLDGGRLSVKEDKRNVWQSPGSWWIEGFSLADSDNDGVNNLNISVWKAGSFGQSKPFWVKKRDWRVRNHFFVFKLEDDVFKPVWQSSNLSRPNCQFLIGDANGNGLNELIVIEGSYENKVDCQGEYLAVWRWNDWGFYNQWRSEKGKYDKINLDKIKHNYGN